LPCCHDPQEQEESVAFIKPLLLADSDEETALYECQDGNGVVRGKYLSVFLELCAGLPETSK